MNSKVANAQTNFTKQLVDAVKADDPSAVRLALQSGANVDAFSSDVPSILQLAAKVAGNECIALLLDAGARINRRNQWHYGSALNQAIESRRFEQAAFLLERGADPRVMDSEYQTALHHLVCALTPAATDGNPPDILAAAHGLLVQMLEIVPINQVDRDGASALMLAVAHEAPLETVELLLHLGADPRILSAEGRGVMHEEWTTESVPVLRAIVATGVSINSRDARGNTAIFRVANSGMIEALIDLGADPHAVNNCGQNALAAHIERQLEDGFPDLDVIQSLLEHGLDPHHADYSGQSALELAQESGRPGKDKVVAALLAHQAKVTMRRAGRDVLSVR